MVSEYCFSGMASGKVGAQKSSLRYVLLYWPLVIDHGWNKKCYTVNVQAAPDQAGC